MKLFNSIAAATAIGASLLIVNPAEAQYYGGGYGYNNNIQNGYGSSPYAQPRRNNYQQKTNGYGRTYMTSPRHNQQCFGPCY